MWDNQSLILWNFSWNLHSKTHSIQLCIVTKKYTKYWLFKEWTDSFRLSNCLTDWLIDWLIGWLNWLTDWFIYFLIDRFMTGWHAYHCLFLWLLTADWSTYWHMTNCFVTCWLTYWPMTADWLADWLMTDWLFLAAGWLTIFGFVTADWLAD